MNPLFSQARKFRNSQAYALSLRTAAATAVFAAAYFTVPMHSASLYPALWPFCILFVTVPAIACVPLLLLRPYADDPDAAHAMQSHLSAALFLAYLNIATLLAVFFSTIADYQPEFAELTWYADRVATAMTATAILFAFLLPALIRSASLAAMDLEIARRKQRHQCYPSVAQHHLPPNPDPTVPPGNQGPGHAEPAMAQQDGQNPPAPPGLVLRGPLPEPRVRPPRPPVEPLNS